jgi:hypothetical protein
MIVMIGGRSWRTSSGSSWGAFRFDDDFLDLVDAASLFAFLALEEEAVGFADLGGDVGLDRLVRGDEHLELDQVGKQNEGLEAHPRGEFADDDRRLDADVVAGVLLFGGCFGHVGDDRGDRGRGKRCRDLHDGCRLLFLEELRDDGQDGFAGLACLLDGRALLLGAVVENIEGVGLGGVEGAGRSGYLRCRLRGGALAFAARGCLGRQIEDLAFRRNTVAVFGHQAGRVVGSRPDAGPGDLKFQAEAELALARARMS